MDAFQSFIPTVRRGAVYRLPVIPLLIAFAGGLAAGEKLFLPRPLSGLLIIFCLAVMLTAIRRRQTAPLAPLLLFFFLGWFSMTGFAFPKLPDNHVSRLTGETPWTITGAIINEPVTGPDRRQFFLKPQRLDHGRRHIRPTGNLRVIVYGPAVPGFRCGDVIRFQGRIRAVTNFKNPGGFDYRRFLAFKKVFGLTYANSGQITILPADRFSGFWPVVEAVRGKIAGQIEKSGQGPSIGILKALVIGRQTDLDPELREAFSRAGVAHLLAISGMQVAVVAGLVFLVLSRLLAFIPALTWRGWVKKGAALGTLPAVAVYGLLAGLAPSTQRAVLMAAIFLTALVAGRRHQLTNTLSLAALIILAVDPPSLYSVSFQLSFASVFFIVAGIITAKSRLERLPNKWLRRGVAFVLVSAFAIAGTTPLTAFYFNQFSWVGLLANCIMIPLVEFVSVPLGLGGVALWGFCPGLSLILLKTAGILLNLGCAITEIIADLPGASFKTVTPNLFEISCYYALFWALAVFLKGGTSPLTPEEADRPPAAGQAIRRTALVALIAGVGLIIDLGWWAHQRWFHDDLRITVLDVGQGNAALLELPGGRCLLLDGGGFTGRSTFDTGKMIVGPFLWRRKIATVDTLILTHPDTDHLAGLIYIAEHFHVRRVWSNGENMNSEIYRDFITILEKKQIGLYDLSRLEKQRLIDGVGFEILYPPDDFLRLRQRHPWRNTNNNSLVTRISLGEISFLFPGDLMAEGERDLTIRAGARLAGTVLMAPHHGSRTSSTAFFLAATRPELIVVSAGHHNRFGCPAPEVLDRYARAGAAVVRTDQDGAVVMSTDGTRLTVKTPLGEPPKSLIICP